MHVLLQPSFTESFNVVTADGIAEGVPTVTSEAIDWVPSTWQADPDDAGDVACVAEYLLKSPKASMTAAPHSPGTSSQRSERGAHFSRRATEGCITHAAG